MPCQDISAVITVVLGGDERLRYYLFEKITCGKIIPLSNRLKEYCQGMDLDSIEALRFEDVVSALGVADEESFFLLDKEMDALQSAVANYRGTERGLDYERYKIESIEHGEDTIKIKQVILEPKPDAPLDSCRTIYKST